MLRINADFYDGLGCVGYFISTGRRAVRGGIKSKTVFFRKQIAKILYWRNLQQKRYAIGISKSLLRTEVRHCGTEVHIACSIEEFPGCGDTEFV